MIIIQIVSLIYSSSDEQKKYKYANIRWLFSFLNFALRFFFFFFYKIHAVFHWKRKFVAGVQGVECLVDYLELRCFTIWITKFKLFWLQGKKIISKRAGKGGFRNVVVTQRPTALPSPTFTSVPDNLRRNKLVCRVHASQ